MRFAILASVAFVSVAMAGETKLATAPLGIKLADWSLPRADNGKPWSLAVDGRDAKAVVVLFIGTECPVSNAYLPVLTTLAKDYESKGVLFVGVNSNRQDDADAVAKHAKEHNIPFVLLKDEGAKLADRFAAKRTPEAFVLDGTRTVCYRGRIDDQFDKGIQRPKPKQRDLVTALDAVLAGKDVAVTVTEPAGCFISRTPKAKKVQATSHEPVTYSKEVARIIQKHCQECHRPGEAAPFKLMNYGDAAAWSEAIREAVSEKRMPPWGADQSHGKFKNARVLSHEELSTLQAWVDQGCPEGNAADLPTPRAYTEGWHIPHLDEVFTMKEAVKVPARAPAGGMPYKYLLIGEPFKEDKWVQAIEAHPSARGVVHHIIVFVIPPSKRAPRSNISPFARLLADFDPTNPDGFGERFLTAYAPGDVPVVYPPGMGKKIAKGSQLLFEMHYTPNGTACEDRSSVGIVYAKTPPAHPIHTRTVMEERFLIPPMVSDHRIDASSTFDRPAVILGMAPHMHLRGKSFSFYLTPTGKEKELVLSVPKYDFNWQMFYVFDKYLHVPKGTRLDCEAHYDNSPANPNNPNPRTFVTWGQQTHDEMMIGFVDYYYDDEK